MPYKAHFDPQAWIHDYATSVDAEEEQTWDCTAFVEADPELKAKVDEAIADEGYFLDRDDALMGDDNAPQWVRDWSGPFTITVQKADISDKQRTAATEALGYALNDEAIQAAILTHDGRTLRWPRRSWNWNRRKRSSTRRAGEAWKWRTRSTPCGCSSRFPRRSEQRRVVL